MALVSNEVRLATLAGKRAPRQHGQANQRPRPAQQPDALEPTGELTEAPSMRWSMGPDGRLDCRWDEPTPPQSNETEDPVGWRQAPAA
jgi:hypothetical protein